MPHAFTPRRPTHRPHTLTPATHRATHPATPPPPLASRPAGSTFVAVATSCQLLRLFTLGGAQQAVLRLEGQPVALVAAGGQLAVAWHSGAGGRAWGRAHIARFDCWLLIWRRQRSFGGVPDCWQAVVSAP